MCQELDTVNFIIIKFIIITNFKLRAKGYVTTAVTS